MFPMGGKGFLFIANDLCLDFVNTQPIREGKRVDLLTTFSDCLEWLVEAGALESGESRILLGRWQGAPESEAALERALALRAELTVAARCLAAGEPVPASAVEMVNRWLREPRRFSQVVATEGGLREIRRWRMEAPADLLSPLAEFAKELFCEKSPDLIRQCGNPDCVLYFYDTTKNHARRWCSMDACGNRHKVARFRARQANP